MRRIELISAIENVNVALSASKIFKVVGGDKPSLEECLAAYQVFFEQTLSFGKAENQIMEMFALQDFLSMKFWAVFIAKEKQAISPAYLRRLRTFVENVPLLVALLKQDNLIYSKKAAHLKEESPNIGREMLTVILPEKENEQSNPERLIKVLDSINVLYESFSTINHLNETNLTVAAIDSGSDKSFDFLGAAKLIEEIKELVIALWDRVVFYKERQVAERVDLIIKSLPVLERIVQLENSQHLSPEQAEILKRNVMSSATKFLEAGAVIPEIYDHAINEPRKLLAPQPKLLKSFDRDKENGGQVPPPQVDDSKPDEKNPLGSLSEDEVKKLRDYLNKQNTSDNDQ